MNKDNFFHKIQRRAFLVSALFLFLAMGCGSQKAVTEPPVFTEIRFGEGGGITGKYMRYLLMQDGKLYRLRDEGEKELIRTFESEKIESIDSLARVAWEVEDLTNDPGNINMNIQIKKEEESRTYRWGKPGREPPESILELWGTLRALPNAPILK